ncbi:hypothetical protein HZS_6545 [Henneguya salminicola]|nr:hypothetical protein HZS_6545 [Henneguya salminicola]
MAILCHLFKGSNKKFDVIYEYKYREYKILFKSIDERGKYIFELPSKKNSATYSNSWRERLVPCFQRTRLITPHIFSTV